MEREKQKTANYKIASIYYLVGNLFNKGISFFTVPIFTRILSTNDYGLVTTYNSWVGILAMILGFALYMGIRMSFVDYEDEVHDYMSSTLCFTIITSGAISSIIVAVLLVLNIKVSIVLVVLCLFNAISSSIIQDYSMYLMMRYQYKARTMFMILPNLIAVILSVVLIKYVLDSNLYMGRIVSIFVVYALFAIIICFESFSKKWVFHFEYIKYGLKLSAPLILHGIALQVLSQSDRMMITALASASMTGIYSLIYNFSMIATVITTSLDGTWVPWFINKIKDGNTRKINELSRDYINLMTCSMVGLILIAPEIVKILANKPYWEGIAIIPPIVLSNYVIFMYTMYVNVEHYYKKTLYITCNTIIAAVVNVALNFLFIPKYGYYAAAYTTLISYLISFILHARYSRKLEPELYPLNIFILPIIKIVIACIVFYLAIDLLFVRWLCALVYLIVEVIISRDRIFNFFPNAKQLLRK